MSQQGYLRTILKVVAYSFIALIVFFVLLFGTQDEEEIREFFGQTGLTQRLYDWWDWKRFQEDFDDVVFTGKFDLWFSGDTTGMNFEPRRLEYLAETAYKKYFGEETPYVNLDNLELLEREPHLRRLADEAEPDQIQIIEIEISTRWLGIGPVYYKVVMKAGTDAEHPVVENTYFNLGSKRKLKSNIENVINREMKSWAKRFNKIQDNREQLEKLQRSVFTS